MSFSDRKKSICTAIYLSLFFIFFQFPCRAASPTQDIPKADASKPIQVRGDSVEYFQQEQKAVGTGHVVIDYEGAKLEADKITVYMETKKALAEGNVTLTQKGSVFKGERAEYNFGKKIGYVDKMDATITPSYYAKAMRIEKVSDQEYKAVDSYVTTCCGDSPFYKIQAKEVNIFPEDKIVMRNALLYIKNVPVIFIPYYVQPLLDFDRLPVQLEPGRSRQYGAFLLSKWRYHLVDREDFAVKGNLLLDYRERRGIGAGTETFYKGDKIGHGAVRTYYISDKEYDNEDARDRYRAQWRHQSKLSEDTTMIAEINGLSDDQMLKDFFYRQEYEANTIPENYISIITAKPEYTLSILERNRLNDFYPSVDRSPEVRFDTHNRQFMETPFYLRQEAQFSNLKKAAANAESETDIDGTRFDINHTLSYAARVGDVSVTPRIGTRQTYFSRDLDGDTAHGRGTVDPGIDLSTRFYKTYDVYIHQWGLDYNKIRHVFQPTLSYDYRPNPTVSRTKLQQFDDIDAIDKQNIFRLSFENNFQTKHRSGDSLITREIIRIYPYMDYDVHTHLLSNIGYTGEFYPYPWMGMTSDGLYNPHTGMVETANFDVYFRNGGWNVSLGERYVINSSSQLTTQVSYTIKDWEFKIYNRYEFKTGNTEETELTVSKYWSCIITDFSYNHRAADKNINSRAGDTFFFTLRLRAFPQAPFSMRKSYDYPRAAANRPLPQ